MAFSYSDKDFTVIGNLCFVHILLNGKQVFYDIPRAIRDRMLFGELEGSYGDGEGEGYLNCCFPIDSNK